MAISCGKEPTTTENEYPIVISGIFSNNSENSLPIPRNRTLGIRPQISIPSNYSIIYINNINLDFDPEQEQVIVVVDRNKQSLKIMVLDFDTVRNKYILTWETEKINVNYRTISISYMDVVGDHGFEIIFNAVSLDGKQTMSIYRKTHAPHGSISLYYESIFDVEINGKPEIQRQERSQAYILGQRNGISFPIITLEDDEQQQNVIKTTYMWSFQANKYVSAFTETISARVIEEQRIREIGFDNIELFKDFLEGQWYNVESDDSVISFHGMDNEVVFFSPNLMEVLRWSNATHSRLNRTIDINARNDQIHFIRNRITIRIINMNRIRVDITDRDNLKNVNHHMDGYYIRLSSNILSSTRPNRQNDEFNIILSGEFFGENNSIVFNEHNFSLRSGNNVRSGIFSIYNFNNDNILELRFIDENHLVRETNIYKISMDHQVVENSVINRITLIRGAIRINSFSPSGEDPVFYMQTTERES